jgi:protocatechuate 3,4-dioxygenase beta subunit
VTARGVALGVTGTVTPLDPGAKVELQQDSEEGWFTTAQATTGAEGEYALAAPEPGTYRVRAAPAQGFAEGLSGQIELR